MTHQPSTTLHCDQPRCVNTLTIGADAITTRIKAAEWGWTVPRLTHPHDPDLCPLHQSAD